MFFMHPPFGKRGQFAPPWSFGPHGGSGFFQARRGDMRPIILKVLGDGPLHGYEVMKRLEEKSQGMWRPSPGSVYPTLQLLEDEDLIAATDKDGKKVYELTAAGRKESEASMVETPWESDAQPMKRFMEFRELGSELMPLLHGIIQSGSDEDLAAVRTILERTKDELKKLTNRPSTLK